MKITFNGTPQEVADGTAVAEFLAGRGFKPAEVVAEIENATREIRDAIEQREWDKARIAEEEADVAKHEERGRRKSQGQHDAKIEAQRREINALRLKLCEAERERDAARRYIIDQQGK